MSFKVPKFNFEEFHPAKPAKVANPALVEGAHFSDYSNCRISPPPERGNKKEGDLF